MTTDFNNTLAQATALGKLSLNETRTFQNSIDGRTGSTFDEFDFYSFTLDGTSDVLIDLTGLSSNANLFLFRDVNGDGRFNPAEVSHKQDLIASSGKTGNLSEQIRIDGLVPAGTYFIAVDAVGTAVTPYSLRIDTNPGPARENPFVDPTPVTHKVNGENVLLNGSRLYTGTVNSSTDTIDRYTFRVETPTQLSTVLIPLGSNTQQSDVDIRLLQGNTVLATSVKSGNQLDAVNLDRLEVGDYTVEVLKSGTGTANYNVLFAGNPIKQANVNLNIDRILSLTDMDSSDGQGESEFFVRATIDGKTVKTGNFNGDRVFPNSTITQSVDVNKRFIPIKLEVFEDDIGFFDSDDRVDINPASGKQFLELTYDTLRGDFFGDLTGRESTLKIVDGAGDSTSGDNGRATFGFKVDYTATTFNSSSTSRTSLTLPASSRALTEGQRGVVIEGEDGNRRLFAQGGDDVLLGGHHRDRMNAGAGDDLLYGGAGRDTQTGGRGRDGFVLTSQDGPDLIRDFQVGKDFLGLAGLKFDDLQLLRHGSSTAIQTGNKQIAILTGVESSSLTANDFVQIDLSIFENTTVPAVVS